MSHPKLSELLQEEIAINQGVISFNRFMELALYEPQFGYYMSQRHKFGKKGDFITAPMITPFFTLTIAKSIMQILSLCSESAEILEFGAGDGTFALDLLRTLEEEGNLPQRYLILDTSENLRILQKQALQEKLSDTLFSRIHWINEIPENFEGVIFGNEVLDSLPVYLVRLMGDQLVEMGVSFNNGNFVWQTMPVSLTALQDFVFSFDFPSDVTTEICLHATTLIENLAKNIKRGAMLWIDYGFSRSTYYHPQRNQGTLMCHFQHYAHSNPLTNIGLQDITAHVDFTRIAEAGLHNDMQIAGYTTQAQFLLNSGILDIFSERFQEQDYAKSSSVQKLLSPAEMGELFKVILMTKDIQAPDESFLGFQEGDKAHTL